MSAEISTPVNTTVLAFDFLEGVREAVDSLAEGLKRVGYVTKDEDTASLTLTLPPEEPIDAAIANVAHSVAAVTTAHRSVRVRGVVHHGTVFQTKTRGHASYIGSAIRSTQSALRRAPAVGGLIATKEFANHTEPMRGLPFHLKPFADASHAGFSHMVFSKMDNQPAAVESNTPASQASIELNDDVLAFLKQRLAQDLGPFAMPLVQRALSASKAPSQLIPALAAQIDNPAARLRFEQDVRTRLANLQAA